MRFGASGMRDADVVKLALAPLAHAFLEAGDARDALRAELEAEAAAALRAPSRPRT